MTEQYKNPSESTENVDVNNAQSNPTDGASQADQAQSNPTLEDIIVQKDEQIKQLEQALLMAKKNESEAMIRARAEIDNVRRRVEQDVEKAHKFALEKFSTELLTVIDNLDRALATMDKDNPEHKNIIEGIELTAKSFLDTMKKFGVEVVCTADSQLNPDCHQAISMIESPAHQSGQIVDTIQKGYTLNGRLIRPAMVIVAK